MQQTRTQRNNNIAAQQELSSEMRDHDVIIGVRDDQSERNEGWQPMALMNSDWAWRPVWRFLFFAYVTVYCVALSKTKKVI